MFFNLFPSTIITIGYKNSCLTDIEKSIFCKIPNSMAKLFVKKKVFI